ncbi:MAG: metallophosphoesterase [bacterium]
MNYWIITDTHFGNHLLRPEGYENKILSFIKTIDKDDILIHLGDFCWDEDSKWVREFCNTSECKKWFLMGNHDKKSMSWYLQHGFDFVAETITLNLYGHKIMFSHIPQRDIGIYTINIHGHLHDFTIETIRDKDPLVYEILNDKQYLIALEYTNYQAITLSSIIKKYNKRKRG